MKIYQKNMEENSIVSILSHFFLLFIAYSTPLVNRDHIINNNYFVSILTLILVLRIVLIYVKRIKYSSFLSEILMYLTGLWWALALSIEFYFSFKFDVLVTVLLFIVIGITAGGALSMFKRKRMVIIYVLLLMVPTMISVYLFGRELSHLLGGALVLFLGFNLVYSLKQNKIWNELQNSSIKIRTQTLELTSTNFSLNLALKKTQEAAKAKSEFLANMSHEIRTPMNGVIGASDILKGLNLGREESRMVDIIHRSANSLLTIINDILDFSKIEAGKLEIEQAPFDLLKTIENVVEIIRHNASKKEIELVVYFDHKIDRLVIGDETRITQILINLLGNAIKFTPKGQVFLRVDLLTNLAEEFSIKFSVEDTGIGIPPEKQKKIFESFTQAEGSTTRKFGGTGLGTTISKMLVDLMHGTIGLVSPNPNNTFNNKGSIFYFLLKLKKGEALVLKNRADSELRVKKVLIIDDNETNCYVLSRMLSNWNIKTCEVNSGAQAIRLIEQDKNFDVIFIDYNMPNYNGIELFSIIKSTLKKSTKTILFSSNSTDINNTKVKEVGIDLLLLKPLKQSELFNALLGLYEYNVEVKKSPQLPNFNFEGLKILLVEDNIINQKIAISVFKQVNIKVDIVNNGEEALRRIEMKDYNLIFMDIQMPVLDGIETVKIMRKQGDNTIVIAMTANAMKGDKEMCLDAGMNDYISKPFKKDNLYTLIDKYKESILH